MSVLAARARWGPGADIEPAVRAILEAQTAEGAVPWFEGGPWDAWNHAECLMALMLAGERGAAESGLAYLAQAQERSGAWLCDYGAALPMAGRDRIARVPAPQVRDTNFTAYPATAIWTHWRAYGDRRLVSEMWPCVREALNFVLRHQHEPGDVSWCGEAHGGDADDSLVAGCASIFSSLGHGLALADIVGDPQPDWFTARARLRDAILTRPERFDRTRSRSEFAMDWYYPVLAGVLDPLTGAARLEAGLTRFIEVGRGCRCVASQPWATVAETAELAMSLIRLGRRAEAARLLDWQDAHRDIDGVWWMGWQFAEAAPWPLEKPTWTQAAMILARHALHETGSGAGVLVAG